MTGFLIVAAVVIMLGAFAGGVYVQRRLGGAWEGKLMALKEQAEQTLGQLEGEARIRALALKNRADQERIALVKRAAEAAGVKIQVL